MKSIKQFLQENFSITRQNMPQIEDVDGFLDWLNESKGVGSWPYFDYVDSLKPSQSEGFDEQKIESIISDMRKNPDKVSEMKEIIVSDDGFVVDGHHRYLAANRIDVKIPFVVVYEPANKLLRLAYEYESTK